MKDYLHLFGGMAGGVALLAAYIFGWGALMRCHGAEAENPQPVLIGDLQPQHVEHYFPQTGEVVIIGDAPYVVISLATWERWTNAVARLEAVAERRWANEHKTDAGRRAWHGALKERKQTEDGRGIQYTYADGFTYTEQAEPSRRASPAVERARKAAASPPAAPQARAGATIPPRLKAKREAVLNRPAAREVNATFGPGGKLLNVEGEK